MKYKEIPFKASFSLRKLIDFWRKSAENTEDCIGTDFARNLVSDVEKIPELNDIITDPSVLQKHESLIDALMSVVFPPAYWESNMIAVSMPLDFKAMYATPKFTELFTDSSSSFESNFNYSPEYFEAGKHITVYAGILKQVYNIDMTVVFPLIRKITDEKTGLERYFKFNMDNRFVDLK